MKLSSLTLVLEKVKGTTIQAIIMETEIATGQRTVYDILEYELASNELSNCQYFAGVILGRFENSMNDDKDWSFEKSFDFGKARTDKTKIAKAIQQTIGDE